MTRRISDDLRRYVAYAKVVEVHLAGVAHAHSINRDYYSLIKDKMQEWLYNILNIFEIEMLREGKFHYVPLVGVLRKKIKDKFREIESLEGVIE